MRQRSLARVFTGALAAVGVGLVSAVVALPAAAADIAVLSSDFEGATAAPWGPRGGTTVDIVDTDAHGGTHSLSVTNRTANWHGTEANITSLVAPGSEYDFSGFVKLAPGVADTAVKFTLIFDDSDFQQVGSDPTATDSAWVEIGGTYTIPAGATKVVLYVEAAAADASFLVDDIVVFGPEAGTPPPPPPPAGVVVSSVDFNDGTDGEWSQSGSPVLAYVDDGNGGLALSITRAADYEGIQTVEGIFEPGVEYTLSMRAKLPEGTPGSVSARFVVKPQYTWVPAGGVAVTADDWVTITGTYTIPAEGVDPLATQVYLGLGPADATVHTVIVDDILITRPATGIDLMWDFEDGLDGWGPRDGGGGAPTITTTTAEAHGGEYAALISDRVEAGSGMGIDLTDQLEAGQTYDITAFVKTVNSQDAAQITLSMQSVVGETTSYDTVQRLESATNYSWTEVETSYTVPTPKPDLMFLYFESWYSIVNTSDLLVDDVRVASRITEWDDTLTPLKDTVDFPIGVAIDSREASGGPSELLVHHFDQITGENHMKPEAWYTDGEASFAIHPQAESLMDFASANDLDLYGHTLVWHSQTPEWFFQDAGRNLTDSIADQEILRARLENHINNVAAALSTGGGYGLFGSDTNPVTAFDVVNEVVADGESAATLGLRDSRWYQVLGENFIDLAFEYADIAFNETYAVADTNPVTLFINDYNTEDSGKAGRILALVERLVDRDVPVTGVGHQFHVNLNRNVGDLEAAIDTFADLLTADGDPMMQAVTELDVTIGTPVTTRNLIEQGHYYKAVFDMLRAKASEIFCVTIWGLTDGRSWRVTAGAPLVFDDNLSAKPAYYGIADPASLPPRQQAANVFRADVPIDADVLTDPVWTDLPLIDVGTAAQFQLRWSPDGMVAYVDVDDTTVDAEDAVVFSYQLPADAGLTTVTVNRSDADSATQVVESTVDGWTAVVALPLAATAAVGTAVLLDVDVTDGATTTSWNDADGLGTLTFVERVSVTEVVEASTSPTIDGEIDDVWADAQTVSTGTFTQGTDGATALVRTLWAEDTLYVLMRVSDPVLNDDASSPWEEDSVEIYVDRGNLKNGAYRNEMDTQYRINFNNVRSFGSGNEAWQSASIESATRVIAGGYLVEAAIDLNGQGRLGSVQGLDFQVNDASAAGVRTSIVNWADATGIGYQNTSRWGVGKLVETASAPYVPGLTSIEPVRAVADWQVAPDRAICVPMAGENGIPWDATGVVVNVTTVRPNSVGYVTVYPDPAMAKGVSAAVASAPKTSTVNFEPGQDVANATFVGLGANGGICYMTHGASRAGVLIDVQGYVTDESGIVTLTPERILDTRSGANHVGDITGPVAPRTEYTVDIAGNAGVPADASAVIVNVTVQGPTSVGNLRVYPGGTDLPNASVINYAAGREKANTTIVQLPESGDIAFYSDTPASAAASPVQVIIDLVGYMTADSTYTGVAPERVLDTRRDGGRLVAGELLTMQIADNGPVPVDATSVMLNVTAVGPTTNGNLRVFPDPSGDGSGGIPGASTINYIPGRDIPNLVVVDVPTSGTIAFYTDQFSGGSVHLVVDVIGYVSPAAALVAAATASAPTALATGVHRAE